MKKTTQTNLFKFSVIGMILSTYAIWLLLSFQLEKNGIFIQSNFYLELIFGLFGGGFIFLRNVSFHGLVGKWTVQPQQWSYVFLTIALFVLTLLVIINIIYLLSPTVFDVMSYLHVDQTSHFKFESPIDDNSWIQDLILMCAIAPIVEEVVFRGLVLQNLMQRMSVTRAIFLSSLAFAVIHVHPFMLIQFGFGIIVSVIYIKTQSLLVTIAAHILDNGIIKLMSLIDSNIFPNPLSENEIGKILECLKLMGPWLLVIMTIGMAVYIYVVRRLWPTKDTLLPYYKNIARETETSSLAP